MGNLVALALSRERKRVLHARAGALPVATARCCYSHRAAAWGYGPTRFRPRATSPA